MEIPKIDTGFDDDDAAVNSSSSRRDLSKFSAKVDTLEKAIQLGLGIRRPNPGEAFCRTEDAKEVASLIDRHYDDLGKYQGELFYPVIDTLQEKVKGSLRLINFVGCLSETGEYFIFPQKMNTKWYASSWNSSLASALSQKPGVFILLSSNAEQQRYEYTVVEKTCEQPLVIADFQSELLNALESNIIDTEDHPVYKKFVTAA